MSDQPQETAVPTLRVTAANRADVARDGDHVLYWMVANRRVEWNYSFDRAVEWARDLGKPLVVLEALRCGYRWASDRLHRFVLEGMSDNARLLADSNVAYYPYIEPTEGAGSGLLEALAQRACLVVTDDFPCFFIPRMVAAVASRLPVRLEIVDSNGILPMRAAEDAFPTAFAFRRFLQRTLPQYLDEMPLQRAWSSARRSDSSVISADVEQRWPRVSAQWLDDPSSADLADLPIDHEVGPVPSRGGSVAARASLEAFLDDKVDRYEDRNQPEQDVVSGLSPYLHFGHISAHEIFAGLSEREGWSIPDLSTSVAGKRAGWWGMSAPAEGFLDQLITWRELGYNMCQHRDDHDRYESLPEWARRTMEEHEDDPRDHVYTLEEFESGRTHDPLWNAAQGQLVEEGRIHNYLRMLWGKKIYQWCESPRDAVDIMIELNNKYAVDGRNPNSYSGIFWVLGRYDRAWGPERPIFGKIRYMTSENTARKVRVREYIERYAPEPTAEQKELFS